MKWRLSSVISLLYVSMKDRAGVAINDETFS